MKKLVLKFYNFKLKQKGSLFRISMSEDPYCVTIDVSKGYIIDSNNPFLFNREVLHKDALSGLHAAYKVALKHTEFVQRTG